MVANLLLLCVVRGCLFWVRVTELASYGYPGVYHIDEIDFSTHHAKLLSTIIPVTRQLTRTVYI